MCHGLFYVMDYLLPVARDVPTYIHTYVQTYVRTYTHTYVRIRGVSGLEGFPCMQGFSKNSWNKVKLQNRYRARWAKGKTGIGLDEHRATHA